MRADPEVKLSGFGAGGRPRLSVRFHGVDSLLQIYKQVRENGVFSIGVATDQPTALQVQVLFRTRRRGEEFPATILTWSRGLAVLQPNLSLADFKELTGSLVINLSAEGEPEAGATSDVGSQPHKAVDKAVGRQRFDTLTDLQDAGAQARASRRSKSAEETEGGEPPTPPEEDLGEPLPATGEYPPITDEHAAITKDWRSVPTSDEPVLKSPREGGEEPSAGEEFSHRAPTRPLTAVDDWLTPTGSFARIPTGIVRSPSGHFERIPSAGVPREAYAFLQELNRAASPTSRGEGTGHEALALIDDLPSPPPHAVFEVVAVAQERCWFLFYEGRSLVTGYLLPASAVTALPTLLSRQGLVSSEGAEAAFAFAARHKVPEETALTEVGAAGPDLLRKALRAKVKLLLALLRSERQVCWELWPLAGPLPLPGLVDAETEHARFKALLASHEERPLGELLDTYADRMGLSPLLRDDQDDLFVRLGLDDASRHFVSKCLTGEHTLRLLPQVSSLGRQRTYAMTFALAELGYVTLLERDAEELQKRRFANQIEAQHEKIGTVHHFDFLNVHWSASEREIMQAAAKLVADYSGHLAFGLGPRHRGRARDVVAEANRIRGALATLEARRLYRGEILDPFAVDQAVELLLSNFDMAVYRRDTAEINRILSRLRELDPAAALKARARIPKGE